MRDANVCLIGLVFVVSVSAEPLLEGQVRLESGEPVADAQVRLFDLSDLRQGAIARAMTDGTGYFALPLAALGGRALPARFALGPNYPNPFNPSTIIPYQLAASSAVRLEVFNLLGQRITTLVDGERPAGFHTATWHATDRAGRAVGAGVYIYRMTVGVESQTGRMVLIDGQAGVSAVGAASVMPGAAGIGGSDGADAHVYGLIVSGSGLVPYVDSSFRVESGMAPVELVVSAGQYSAGKVTDDDCAFCDLFGTFNDQQEDEEDETPEEEEEEETDSTSSEGGPDLVVQAPSVSTVMLTPGQEFTLNVTVHNQGDGQAAATMLHYYRSNNATITSSDTEVGTDAVGALDASATSEKSIALTAPTSVSAEVGIYYGACVVSVRGESDTDNNCSSAVKITLGGQEATEEETTEEEEETTEEEGDETPEEEEETPEEEEGETPEEEEGTDGQVTIPDTNLRAAIEAALGKARGTPITVAEMKTLTSLFASFSGIRDLTGLESATNLTRLGFWDTEITDVSPLSDLTNLTYLELGFNNLTNAAPEALSGLTNLTFLGLGGYTNYITDVSALSGLTNLTELWLFDLDITDVSALSGLTNLTDLSLRGNNITDVSALSGLTNLKRLWLLYNDITDVSALSGLTNLKDLGLGNNNIRDISVLSGLTNLTDLGLGNNNITDISPLAGLINLTSLDIEYLKITDISVLYGLTKLIELRLSGNPITDLSMLASWLRGLTNLEQLTLGSTGFTDISALSGLTKLTWLDLDDNNITDISALAGLTNLTVLLLAYNNITDVSALEGMTSLIELSLRFNAIADISALVGLTNLKWLWLRGNFLNDSSINDHIPALLSRGVKMFFDPSRPKGDYDIELVFLGPFTDNQKNVLQYVARRWMAVISEDLPDYEFTQGWSGQCGGQSYEIPSGERIDDLRIYMGTFEGDVAVGYGGPSLLREETHLPVLGCMAFDLERANLLITGLHEIGHVLGFGTVWYDLGFPQDLDGDTHFNGPLAIAAFNDAGGWDYTGKKVPVEKGDGAHWRVPLLSGELMGPGGGGALSAITVQSVADLGYGVDVTQADAYTLPSATAGKASAKITAAMPAIPGVDVTQADAYALLGDDPHWQGRTAGGLPLLPGDDHLRGRLESAEWIGGRGFDFRDDRLMGRLAPSPRAVPVLSCGVDLRREPIYVIDPQGRIIRTLGD